MPELLLGRRRQRVDRLGPEADQRRTRLDQGGVPGLEVRRRSTPLPVLQEPVALAEGAVVRGDRALLERPQRADGIVEEVATLARLADHGEQVVGPEEHGPNLSADVALAS